MLAIENNFIYALKKTEKIVQAIYLVTSHLNDTEPLKIELREKSLSLLSYSLALNSENSYERQELVRSFLSTGVEISSLMRVASVSGNISTNNATILSNEIESVASHVREKVFPQDSTKGLILSKDFFATDIPEFEKNDKGQNMVNKGLKMAVKQKDRKNSRQHEILDLLKKQSHLTIKDFARVISDCSEKTIQRELIDLVEKGVVVREGERRWSRYSLKSN